MCVQINRFKVTSTERGKPKKKKSGFTFNGTQKAAM